MTVRVKFNGTLLRERRQAMKLSQHQLSLLTLHKDESGENRMVRPEQISNYEAERHTPAVETAFYLARAVGLTVDDLLTESTTQSA